MEHPQQLLNSFEFITKWHTSYSMSFNRLMTEIKIFFLSSDISIQTRIAGWKIKNIVKKILFVFSARGKEWDFLSCKGRISYDMSDSEEERPAYCQDLPDRDGLFWGSFNCSDSFDAKWSSREMVAYIIYSRRGPILRQNTVNPGRAKNTAIKIQCHDPPFVLLESTFFCNNTKKDIQRVCTCSLFIATATLVKK